MTTKRYQLTFEVEADIEFHAGMTGMELIKYSVNRRRELSTYVYLKDPVTDRFSMRVIPSPFVLTTVKEVVD